MQQDFAKSRGNKSSTRGKSTSKPRNKRSTGAKRSAGRAVAPSRYFHGPSFSGGVVLGAIVVIATAYLPEFLPSLLQRGADLTDRATQTVDATVPGKTDAGAAGTATENATAANRQAPRTPTLRFDFEEMLTKHSVKAEPEKYYDPEQQRDAPVTKEILLQAASFRTQREANALRAELTLLDLPTDTASVELENGRWIRVTVGPFTSTVAANRAVTALREQAISPIWIERKTS
ncbi:MAG: SPOR domain-containing protein [Pseudomonadales bacterium]